MARAGSPDGRRMTDEKLKAGMKASREGDHDKADRIFREVRDHYQGLADQTSNLIKANAEIREMKVTA